jgi:hypothetical protein
MYKLVLTTLLLAIVLALVTNSRIIISALAVSSVSSGPVIQELIQE